MKFWRGLRVKTHESFSNLFIVIILQGDYCVSIKRWGIHRDCESEKLLPNLSITLVGSKSSDYCEPVCRSGLRIRKQLGAFFQSLHLSSPYTHRERRATQSRIQLVGKNWNCPSLKCFFKTSHQGCARSQIRREFQKARATKKIASGPRFCKAAH